MLLWSMQSLHQVIFSALVLLLQIRFLAEATETQGCVTTLLLKACVWWTRGLHLPCVDHGVTISHDLQIKKRRLGRAGSTAFHPAGLGQGLGVCFLRRSEMMLMMLGQGLGRI